MNRLLIILLITLPILSSGQAGSASASQMNLVITLSDIRGTPIPLNTSYNSTGTLFYPKDYCLASIKVKNGKKYDGVSVKVNLQDNDIYIKFADGIETISTVPLEYIDFPGCTETEKKSMFRSGFPPVDKQTDRSYYQVLSEGNLLLLKYSTIAYRDEVPYGTSSVIRHYDALPVYYAFSSEKGMTRLKDNAAVIAMVPAQKTEVEKFMSDQGIKVKREADLVKLFTFLNSMK